MHIYIYTYIAQYLFAYIYVHIYTYISYLIHFIIIIFFHYLYYVSDRNPCTPLSMFGCRKWSYSIILSVLLISTDFFVNPT